MTISQRFSEGTATLSIAGRFTFEVHREFRSHCATILKTPGIKKIEVELGDVDYIDSAALGMLLLLKQEAEKVNVQVLLLRSKGVVRNILAVANFNKLFTMT